MDKKNILAQYEQAKEQFAATGVDTDKAIDALPVSYTHLDVYKRQIHKIAPIVYL